VRTFTFASIKGGVGKTTLASHIAGALADLGHETLLIDLDPQGHATSMAGLDVGPEEPCIADALGANPRAHITDVLRETARPKLWVAPANLRMISAERELFRWGHRLQAIPRALKSAPQRFEALVIDTPPQLNAFTEAALAVGQVMVVPVPAMAHALQGFDEIHAAWRDATDGKRSAMIGAVNLWDRRTSATNAAMEEAFKELPVKLAKNRIPRSEALNQAGLGFEMVYEFSRRSPSAQALRELAKELWRMAGRLNGR